MAVRMTVARLAVAGSSPSVCPLLMETSPLVVFKRSASRKGILNSRAIAEVTKILEQEMVHACDLAVPLIAEVKQGMSWYEAK